MRTALVLGGGAARGWAHIGVIAALKEADIVIHQVVGTSIGALVGAIYAAGSIEDLRSRALKMDWKQVIAYLDIVFPRSGLIDGSKINGFVRQMLNNRDRIEDLPLPFTAVATDLSSGGEVVLDSGDILQAVRASIAIPGMFTPVPYKDSYLVDGGLTNPVPVSVARLAGADYVIAVDLHQDITSRTVKPPFDPRKEHLLAASTSRLVEMLNRRLAMLGLNHSLHINGNRNQKKTLPSIYEVLVASINIVEKHITEARLVVDPPNLLIQPRLSHIRLLDFDRAEEAITVGFETTKKALKGLDPKDYPLTRENS
ncbi:patatin-like phospholipase family protein [Desulfolithobacter sp.]